MGQDIHIKIFAKSKIERGKYVNWDDISYPHDIFDGRYYDLFSVFGSIRSDYPLIGGINIGMPDFLPKTFTKIMNDEGVDYHTHSWFYLPEMIREVSYYIEKLRNPGMFMIDGEVKDDTFFDKPEFTDKDGASCLANALEEVLKNLKWLYDDAKTYCKYIEPDKTVVLIYFDN